ncbi:MAG TPA: GDSL-type esterase/lipase family protein [Patescibacteria group bacterium]|nr:GDSL-type esterase/lipase family protein [Patescibacteria group bacterium]
MSFRVIRSLRASHALTKTTQPFMRFAENAHQRIAVLGDSTMYGAGIVDPANTVGGLLAAQFPEASIETLATNGAKIRDMRAQLQQGRHAHYMLLIAGVGGNDIVRFTSRAAIRRNLTEFLDEASHRTQKIVLCHCVNVGNTGFFIFPLNYLFDYRSRQLSKIYAEVSAQFPKVQYVNFYRPMHDDHYTKDTRKHFIAGDAFHPSDYANRHFFGLLLGAIRKP